MVQYVLVLSLVVSLGISVLYSTDVEKSGDTYHVLACHTPQSSREVSCHARIVSDSTGKIKVKRESKKKKGSSLRGQAICVSTTQLGFGPADLQSAYGVSVPSGVVAGSGPTIAVVVAFDYPNYELDLNTYRSNYCLPPCTSASGCLKKVNQDGAASPLPVADAGWNQEAALDMQMISAMCPSCKILLVVASSASLSSLGTAVKTAAALGKALVINYIQSLRIKFTPIFRCPSYQ